jgi:cyclophilin family peptidyl-prolyl cis-trans isomerase
MRRYLLPVCILGLMLTAALSAKPLPRFDPAPPPVGDERTPRVVMETNHGRIVIELYADKAPITVKNFLQYVDDQYYDGTIFHRVIAEFMIQGGGHVSGMSEKKTREPIKNESANGLANERGTIAVARMANADSGTAQFFINTKDNPFLDRAKSADRTGYCVFGKVIEGMDVVDRIRRVSTGQQGVHRDVPVQNVIIRSVRRFAR